MNIIRKKYNYRFILIFCIYISLVSVSVPALPLTRFTEIPDSEFPLRDTVRWEKELIPVLTLLPDVLGADKIRERFSAYKPELTIQKLYRINSLSDQELTNRELFTVVSNILGAPETQVGYTYHSPTKDKDVVLFEESYVSDKRSRHKDGFSFTTVTLPETISYYQYVDEANFSGTVLKQYIEISKDFLSFRSTNTERMWYTIIPVLKAEGTRSEMLVFITGGVMYVYSVTQVEKESAAKKFGLPLHLPSMFGKRMDVWLEDRLMESLHQDFTQRKIFSWNRT